MNTFTVETVSIDTITPYINNPRDNSHAVKEVVDSISKYGWRQPIVVDADNVIVVGHTRYLAAIELGLTEVPIHKAVDLSADDIKAYRIVDNATNESAAWDLDKLQIELKDLTVDGESWDRLNEYIDDFNIYKDSTEQDNYSNSSNSSNNTNVNNLPTGKNNLPTGNSDSETTDEDDLLEMRGASFYDGADGGHEKTTAVKYLTIGKKRIPLTSEEEERLLTAIYKYGEEYGTHFGFATRLIEGKYSNV